ncbi:MAG: efflux RND transporter permease subunit, partial [Proteobacteria bacterium]
PNAGPHMGFIRLQLSDPEARDDTQSELAAQARRLLAESYPGVDFMQAPGSIVASIFNDGYLAPGVVEIEGDDLERLSEASNAVVEVAREVPGLRDPYTNLETSYPELRLETDRELAGTVGVTARDAAQTTLEATLGNINAPSVWVDGDNGQAYYVVTYYDNDVIHDRGSLADTPVRAASGHGAVKLGSYASLERRVGPIAVERNRLGRVATVFFTTEGRDLGTVGNELEEKLRSDPRTRDLKLRYVGQIALMRTTFGGLGTAVGLAIAVVFVVMATQFKSLRLPLVMLFTIPMCIVGIVLALLAAGQGFSITALMGVLMVLGIAMSNGILLVDHANRSLQAGRSATDAMLEAARARVIPILMTSLATAIGLLPTALGLDPASAANRPLALAVVGGLTSSTVLSLFVVPIVFTYLARRTPLEDDDGRPLVVSDPHLAA